MSEPALKLPPEIVSLNRALNWDVGITLGGMAETLGFSSLGLLSGLLGINIPDAVLPESFYVSAAATGLAIATAGVRKSRREKLLVKECKGLQAELGENFAQAVDSLPPGIAVVVAGTLGRIEEIATELQDSNHNPKAEAFAVIQASFAAKN